MTELTNNVELLILSIVQISHMIFQIK